MEKTIIGCRDGTLTTSEKIDKWGKIHIYFDDKTILDKDVRITLTRDQTKLLIETLQKSLDKS